MSRLTTLIIATILVPVVALSQVVLRIDEDVLTKEEFNQLFASYWKDIFHIPIHRATKSDRKDFLIEYGRCMLILKGAKEENIDIEEEELKRALRERVGKLSVAPVIKTLLRCELITEKILDIYSDEPELSENAMHAYYLLNKRDFYLPDRVLLLRVLVRDQKDIALVKNILTYSDKVYIKGIAVGKPSWYSLQTLPRIIKSSLHSYEPGTISKPIPIEGGYLILKILDRRKAGILSFREAKSVIKDKIIKEHKEEVLREWLRNVAKRHDIYIDPAHF